MKIHHYGLATNNFEQSANTLSSLGYSISDTVIDPIQKVKLAFASRAGEPMIEIITDLDANGPTTKIISRSGNGFYHVCYEVKNIEEAMTALRENGFMLKASPVGAVAFKGKKIAWMYNRAIGLIELLEQ